MTIKTMTEELFGKTLKTFSTTINKSMELALALSQDALAHFAAHGDTSRCQQFLDAMPKNYVRKAAFLKWLGAFSPIAKDENGKLVKDKGATPKDFDLEGAAKLPFWDYAPDVEQVTFGYTDVVKSLEQAVAKFRNSKKYKSPDATTSAMLDRADNLITDLKNNPPLIADLAGEADVASEAAPAAVAA